MTASLGAPAPGTRLGNVKVKTPGTPPEEPVIVLADSGLPLVMAVALRPLRMGVALATYTLTVALVTVLLSVVSVGVKVTASLVVPAPGTVLGLVKVKTPGTLPEEPVIVLADSGLP